MRAIILILFSIFTLTISNVLFSDETKEKEPVSLRWLIKRDMPEVLKIEKNSFESPWSEADFLNQLRKRNILGVVAENQEGKIVGFAVYQLFPQKVTLLNMAVARDHRRSKVGTQIIENLMGKLNLKRNRLDMVVGERNLDAQLFFRKMGLAAGKLMNDYYSDSSNALPFSYQLHEGATEGAIPSSLTEEEFAILWEKLTSDPSTVQPSSRETHSGRNPETTVQESSVVQSAAAPEKQIEDSRAHRNLTDFLLQKYRVGRKYSLIASTASQWAAIYGLGNGFGGEVSTSGFLTTAIIAGLASRYLTQQLDEVWEKSLMNAPGPETQGEIQEAIGKTAKLALKTGAIQGVCLVALQRLFLSGLH